MIFAFKSLLGVMCNGAHWGGRTCAKVVRREQRGPSVNWVLGTAPGEAAVIRSAPQGTAMNVRAGMMCLRVKTESDWVSLQRSRFEVSGVEKRPL